MQNNDERARPWVVRLSVPNEQILTGQRINKIWSIPGSDGREQFRWIIRADDGAELTITLYSEKFGESERTLWLQETESPVEGGGGS